MAQLAYDIQFALPASPTTPDVTISTQGDAIILTWDDGVNAVESYSAVDVIDKLPIPVSFDTTYTTGWFLSDAGLTGVTLLDSVTDYDVATATWYTLYELQYIDVIDTTYIGQNTSFTFQGYNVYQLETASGQGARKRIATYDLVDGVVEVYDDVFDPVLGETIYRRVQFGSDSGIKRSIEIDNDGLNAGIPLKTNRAYYFAVTSYGYNPYGIPKTLESPTNILTIRPQIGTTAGEAVTEYGESSIAAEHGSGASDGSAVAVVIDPFAITGDDYQITFHLNADSTTLVWDVKNTSDGTTLVSGNPIQGGVDMETAGKVGVNANPIVEGFQVQVNGPPEEFKDFYTTHNAAGAIDGYAGASADYNGYPGMGRTNIGNQQTNGSTWFITTSNGSNKNYEDFFGYVTRYCGGYGNPDGGIKYLIPDDIEFRFTATGSKMLDWWNTELVVDTPLEIWNIGDVSTPDDDFQLMACFYDSDGNGAWNLYQDDSPISGGSNDPYTEAIYVMEHKDRAPGTAGYEAMVAAFTANASASGNYPWASGAGFPLSAAGSITTAILMNMTFANWNGGDVTADPFVVDADMPELGTIFRMVTTKPNTANDVFTISTSAYKTAATAYDPKKINVWPNPYFATNPEERTPLERRVTFTHLPETGTATIRVFNLAGQLVRKLLHNDGTQYEVWDLNNNFNIPVASGMYIAHVTTAAGDHVLKIGVVQPEERIDVY